jgi:hypothetical protein
MRRNQLMRPSNLRAIRRHNDANGALYFFSGVVDGTANRREDQFRMGARVIAPAPDVDDGRFD